MRHTQIKLATRKWVESFALLLLCTTICFARWENSLENACDAKGCSYVVRLKEIVDKIPHEIFFDWEWEGNYLVNLDDESNSFHYGHEICVDVDGCNGTLVCAQVTELIQAPDRSYVDLVVSGRVEMEKENIFVAEGLKFQFSAKQAELKIPQDMENFLVGLGY